MVSYAYARTHAYAYLQTDIRICGQIIKRIVYNETLKQSKHSVLVWLNSLWNFYWDIQYNETNALSLSYFNQNERSAFQRCSTLFYYRLLHLVMLRHIIRTYSVRISKPCMDGIRSMAFEYFYKRPSLICFILQSFSKYRKAAFNSLYVFFFNNFLKLALCYVTNG